MALSHHSNQHGIALGPILFIIAVLAILAAAIAAGSGGFSASTNTESAKAMAEVLINSCHAYNDALQLMLHNGCDENHLDYTPNGGGYPTGATWTGGDFSTGGTGHTGNGQCAFFDPRGGGMIFKQYPKAALTSTLTGAYSSNYTSDGGANEDVYAGYPFFMTTICVSGLGTCPLGTSLANAAIEMFVTYVNYATCQQINKLLNLSWDPNSTNIQIGSRYLYGPFGGWVLRNAGDAYGYVVGGGPTGHSGIGEACSYDWNSNTYNSAYVYMCTLMVR